jgi:hypothetical protein
MRGAALILALLSALLCSACERPFAEALAPDVRVVAPDLSTVLTADSTTVQVEARSSRTVARVFINGREMTFDADLGLWERTIPLPPGTTPLILTSEDRDGTVGRDTAFAVRLPHRTLNAPRLPAPRAGHTATRLLDGDVLVTGGVSSINTAARTDLYILPRGGGAFQPHGNLFSGRVGHTASLLPDGRVLILGGSRRYNPTTTGDLVESVEIYDPVTGSISPVRFSGEPIRRMHHTAVVRQENGDVLIDLYGGRGDIRYGAAPRLGIRGDLRTFRLSGDSLVALNRLDTASFLVPALGHVQAPTRTLDPGELGRYVVAGTTYGTQSVDTVSFMLDYTAAQGIGFDDSIPSMRRARAFAAAATLGQRAGFILVFGGTQGSSGSALGRPEVYADDARRFVRFPESTTLFRRFDHSATFTGSNRILLLGGFSSSGNALSVGEFFETSL